MKINILEALKKQILICDGAMGTMLQKNGLSTEECPEYWNLTKPEIISNIHKEYIDAGANIILTNTFGANKIKLGMYNLETKIKEINMVAVENAKSVAKDFVYIGGDIGPTGQMIEPLGLLTEQEVYDTFEEQSEYLAKSGVDFIIIETMIAIEEIVLAVKAAKKVTNLPVMALMTFNIYDGDIRTVMGVDVATMVNQLENAGVDIIGTNCGYGIEEMIDIVKAIKKNTTKFIIAEPNAGLPILNEGVITYNSTPEFMAFYSEELVKSGANIIGGCCGTTPEHIRKIKDKLKEKS